MTVYTIDSIDSGGPRGSPNSEAAVFPIIVHRQILCFLFSSFPSPLPLNRLPSSCILHLTFISLFILFVHLVRVSSYPKQTPAPAQRPVAAKLKLRSHRQLPPTSLIWRAHAPFSVAPGSSWATNFWSGTGTVLGSLVSRSSHDGGFFYPSLSWEPSPQWYVCCPLYLNPKAFGQYEYLLHPHSCPSPLGRVPRLIT